jgi:hypothetical protein
MPSSPAKQPGTVCCSALLQQLTPGMRSCVMLSWGGGGFESYSCEANRVDSLLHKLSVEEQDLWQRLTAAYHALCGFLNEQYWIGMQLWRGMPTAPGWTGGRQSWKGWNRGLCCWCLAHGQQKHWWEFGNVAVLLCTCACVSLECAWPWHSDRLRA